jgi:hypothetical protein
VKIDDREVPAAIVAHWKQALGGLPDVALSGVARAHTSIQAGFRPGNVPPAQVKQRAGALMDTLPGLPQPLHEALSAGGLQGELLCVLSEQALERHAGAWCRAFGPVPTSAAMLLDERPAVRALGFSQMAAWDGNEPDEAAAGRARDELAESFAPFLRRLGPLFDRQGPAAGSKAGTSSPTPARSLQMSSTGGCAKPKGSKPNEDFHHPRSHRQRSHGATRVPAWLRVEWRPGAQAVHFAVPAPPGRRPAGLGHGIEVGCPPR